MAGNWFADKLGVQATPSATPATRPPMQPTVNPTTQNVHRMPVAYDPGRDQLTTKAQHLKNSATCPDCGSGNYVKVGSATGPSGPVDAMRCYDCGYPIVQSGTGASGVSTDGRPATPAVQVHGVNNYQPTNLIGKLQ